MRAKIRFFQLCVDDGYIFGLDGNGRVWRTNVNPAKQSNWVMIGSPDVPDVPDVEYRSNKNLIDTCKKHHDFMNEGNSI